VNNNCPNTGWINHDAAIDSTQDPFSSVAQLVNVLNSHCAAGPGTPAYSYTAYYPAGSCKTQNCGKLGCFCTEKYTVNTPYTVNVPAVYPDTCVIVSHSGSDNVVRLLLASYPGDDLWNIRKVYTTSGAGGGSELIAAMGNAEVNAGAFLSDTDTPDTCDFTWWMDVDTSRNGYGLGRWAWDDTSGTGIHHLMEGFSYSGGLDSNWVDDFFPGTNDHGIALHSGLGRADVGYYLLYSDQGPNGNYYGHSLVHIVDYDYYLEPLPYDGHETATQLSPTGSQFVPQSDHFYSKRDWFMYFIGANADLECHGLYPNNPEYCTVSSSSGGGPSWLDTFLNSLVSDGVCLFGCSGYY
jgi:hypothetical protein